MALSMAPIAFIAQTCSLLPSSKPSPPAVFTNHSLMPIMVTLFTSVSLPRISARMASRSASSLACALVTLMPANISKKLAWPIPLSSALFKSLSSSVGSTSVTAAFFSNAVYCSYTHQMRSTTTGFLHGDATINTLPIASKASPNTPCSTSGVITCLKC